SQRANADGSRISASAQITGNELLRKSRPLASTLASKPSVSVLIRAVGLLVSRPNGLHCVSPERPGSLVILEQAVPWLSSREMQTSSGPTVERTSSTSSSPAVLACRNQKNLSDGSTARIGFEQPPMRSNDTVSPMLAPLSITSSPGAASPT